MNNNLQLENKTTEFRIYETFSVKKIGTVLGGILLRGKIDIDRQYSLGPFKGGIFKKVNVKCIHRNKVCATQVNSMEFATIQIEEVESFDWNEVRRGMVLLEREERERPLILTKYFQGDAVILQDVNRLHPGIQVNVNIGNIRQSAILTEIKVVPKGQNQRIINFRLIRCSEYIAPGSKVFFYEKNLKGVGNILRCLD